jgi:hypothetical protein
LDPIEGHGNRRLMRPAQRHAGLCQGSFGGRRSRLPKVVKTVQDLALAVDDRYAVLEGGHAMIALRFSSRGVLFVSP